MDLVSIIVPVYNVEVYLKACMDSIIGQTYSNIEIILVDDGSKDNSGSICDAYAKKDNRIIVIHKDNSGVSDSRNIGIELSKGKYLCFIDADDIVEKEYIEKLVEPLKHGDYDLVICNYSKVFDDGRKISNVFSENLIAELSHNFFNDYHKIISVLPFIAMKMFKRSTIIENNIRFPVEFKDVEDQMFNFQYYNFVYKYYFINESLYRYIQRDNSSSKYKSIESYRCNLLKLKEEKSFYQKHSVANYENLIVNNGLNIIKKYVLIDSYDNSYHDYKLRVLDIKKVIAEELRKVNYGFGLKRSIAIWCLKYNLYGILYYYHIARRYF